PVFGPWHDLLALPEETFRKQAPAVLERWAERPWLNPLVRDALLAVPLETKADVARAYGTLLKEVHEESKRTRGLPDVGRKALLEILAGHESPTYFPRSQTRRYMSRADTDAFGGKLRDLDVLAVKEPRAPARAMALVDAADLVDPHVFVRGNSARTGDPVP